MSKKPDLFEDLRRVGEFKRDRMDGRPADNALAKITQSGVSRDTVGAWLRGDRCPQRLAPLLAVIAAIRVEASSRGLLETSAGTASGESVADLLTEGRWSGSWAAEQERRKQVGREGLERQQGHKALEDEERRARQAALTDRPRPVRSWTLQRLGVHPAVSGHRADMEGSEFVVPSYVHRPHDARLRSQLTTAVKGGTSLLAVVRGKSCTGKTRTAAEAVKAVVPDGSPLLFPADAEGLLAALDADVLGPGSVLWLNEAQDYLTGPAGETVAAALLRRLDAEDPLLVIATLWPDYDQTLTTLPSPGSDDPHRQARALLAQAQYTYLPGSFADDMDAVRDAAGTDASLTAVLESAGVDLAQALAAGPDLVTHYEHPAGQDGNYGKALISAAMDAHRLGITTPLPLDFLRHAAAGYLTESERAADPVSWFPGALAYAQTLIKHTTRPLQNVPHPSGMGALPGRVRLADYLQQHGRHTRRHLCPPADFWDAATAHLDHADDLFQLAFAARLRHRLRWAQRLYLRAAQAGSVPALSHLASWATEPQEAEKLLRQAFRAGDTGALLQLGRLRENAHDAAGAEDLYHQAITAGDSTGYAFLASMHERTGDLKEAERLYRLAIRHGAIGCLSSLAHLHDSADNLEVAARLYRKAIDAGATGRLVFLARLHHEAGEQNAAEACYQEAIDVGEGDDLVHLAEMYSRVGHYDEATAVIGRAAEAGVLSALVLTVHPHDVTAARSLYRKALAAGDDTALTLLGKIRESLDDHDRAEHLYVQAANCGSQQRQFYVRWPYGLEPDGTPTPAH